MARHCPAPAAPRRSAPRRQPPPAVTHPRAAGRDGTRRDGPRMGPPPAGGGSVGPGRVDHKRNAAGPPPLASHGGDSLRTAVRLWGRDGDGGSPGCRRCNCPVAVEENRILALGREVRLVSLACGHGLLRKGSHDPKQLGSGGLRLHWPPTPRYNLGMGTAWRVPLLFWGLLGSGTTCWLWLCFMSSGQWLCPVSPLQFTGVYSVFCLLATCPGEPQGPWWPAAGCCLPTRTLFLPIFSFHYFHPNTPSHV